MDQIVWMYWQQGVASAPPLVQACVDSWVRANPTWEVRVLDADSLVEYPDFPLALYRRRSDLDVQKIADLLRLYLLRNHGGVWADATTYCAAPLDTWLPDHTDSGFFAFCDPGRDRLISNWFLAAEPGNELVRELDQRLRDHLGQRRFWLQPTRIGRRLVAQLAPLLGKNVGRTRLWLSLPVRRLLRVYPYFVFHYTFNDVVARGGPSAAIWEATPRVGAGSAHELQRLARSPDGLVLAREIIDSRCTPIYKLDWRVDAHSKYWAGALHALASVSERTAANDRPTG